MTPLRNRMIQAMRQRRLAHSTCQSYLYSVISLARYTRESPDKLTISDIQRYFEFLVQEKNLSASSCILQLQAIKFLYVKVLGWPDTDFDIVVPKKPQNIPDLLTRKQVGEIISQCKNHKHRMMLKVCYGCGLRVGEVVKLRVSNIDGERHLLKVVQAKGKKDRMVIVGPHLLVSLRQYWSSERPQNWLFPSNSRDHHLGAGSLQRVYRAAKQKAGVDKDGGIHGLRHAYATHQLAAGMSIVDLQHQMGHASIMTTMRYLHWVPDYRTQNKRGADLLAQLEDEQS